MRARLLVVVLSIPLVSGCDCSTRGVQKAHGILSMSPKALDFGLGCLGSTNEQQVVLTNEGNTTVTIDPAKSKVTGASFSLLEALPASLDAGESVAVRIGFTPTTADDFAGQFDVVTDADVGGSQTAHLVGDGSDLPDVDFEVTCPLSAGDTQFQTCAFLGFDDVPVGGSADAVARLENNGCGPLTVRELSFYPDPSDDTATVADTQYFSLPKDKAPFTIRGGDHRDVTVHFAAPLQERESFPVRLRLFTTDTQVKAYPYEGEPGSWDLGMFANSVGPSLLVDTDRLTFFDAQTGQPDAKTFQVENTGSAALDDVTLTIVPDHGTTAFTLGTGDEGPFTLAPTGTSAAIRKVTVTYTPTHAGGDSATIEVKAGNEKQSVSLIAGTEPELVVKWLDAAGAEEDPPVDFGQTPAGAQGVTRTVRLENAGSATLNVSSVTVPDETNPAKSYSVAPFTPAAIAPGDHLDLTVTFDDAVTLRNDTAKLNIVTDDPAYDASAGAYEVDLDSENEPDFPPVPKITVCAHPSGSTSCSTGPSLTEELTVDGSGSTDPENDALTFHWALVVKPASSRATLDTPDSMQTRIVGPTGTKPDVVGNYVVQLKVTDTFNQSSTVSQSINVQR